MFQVGEQQLYNPDGFVQLTMQLSFRAPVAQFDARPRRHLDCFARSDWCPDIP